MERQDGQLNVQEARSYSSLMDTEWNWPVSTLGRETQYMNKETHYQPTQYHYDTNEYYTVKSFEVPPTVEIKVSESKITH